MVVSKGDDLLDEFERIQKQTSYPGWFMYGDVKHLISSRYALRVMCNSKLLVTEFKRSSPDRLHKYKVVR